MSEMPSPADRDAGVARIAHATKWVAALAAGLVGVFAGLAAAAHPGRAAHASAAARQPTPATTTTQDPASDPGLQPPAQAPAPAAPAPSGPVSGGS